ncbi:MAG: hypothetical protein U0821_22500 [Chloroflexota bacterium]
MVAVVRASDAPDGSSRPAAPSRAAMSVWKFCFLRFRGSLVFTAPLAPILAALITVAAYSMDLFNLSARAEHVLIAGTANLLIAWLGLSLLHAMLGLSAPAQVNATSYRLLRSRLDELEARVAYQSTAVAVAPPHESEADIARDEIHRHIADIRAGLSSEGTQWITGHAPNALWRRVHRAEEAWLVLAPPEDVVDAADEARLCIADSKLARESAKLMKEQLGAAVPVQSGGPFHSRAEVITTQARVAVRSIWLALHNYRDDRWDALMRARNKLLVTLAVSAIVAYGMLCLSILADSKKEILQGVVAFYFVGALVGVLDRLYSQSRASRAVDDYGLSLARLLTTPHLSGLAAILGIIFVSAASPAATGSSDNGLSTHIFSALNAPSLALAAVFGLSPRLLFEEIRKRTDLAQTELKSTLPAESGGRTNDDGTNTTG